MAAALASLAFGFSFEALSRPLFGVYFFGEYVFCFLLIAGCRNFSTGKKPALKEWALLVPFALLSIFLSAAGSGFNAIFNIHSFILASGFFFGFTAIKSVQKSEQNNFGWYVMRTALALLAISFYNYVLAFTFYSYQIEYILPVWVLSYNSIFDLVLETLLGFGMVIVLLEEANRKLKEAHARLEAAAQLDPLTEAFNRHAFYGFLHREKEIVSGCVGVFDIDNLKPINDRHGHFAGDMAIKAVVRAIRAAIRAEDLIFRWGGDEFFVIMISMDAEMARERMRGLKEMLNDIKIDGLTEAVSVGVSYGFANFSGAAELQQAMGCADAEMYRAKQENKTAERAEEIPFIPALVPQRSPSIQA
jgi:diguanylate cyclase (GGDEF)-like protein